MAEPDVFMARPSAHSATSERRRAAPAPDLVVADAAALLRVTRVLRALGALLLVASGSVFMLQHWQRGNDGARYLMLLGQTVVLALAGVACGTRVREARSARSFMALVAALVPVNFSVLSALLYSRLSWDAPGLRLPAYASWHAPSTLGAIGLLLIALLLLVPLCWLSMRVLSRGSAGILSAVFFGLNALLLVPIRGPSFIALLLGCGLCAVLCAWSSPRLRGSELRTPEGRFARALLLAPCALLVARTWLFYEPTALFDSVLSFAVSCACFIAAQRTVYASVRAALELTAAAAAALACGIGGSALCDALGWAEAATIPCMLLPYLGVLLLMAALSPAHAGAYRNAAALLASAGFAANLALHPSLATSSSCLVAGVLCVSLGAYAERMLAFAAGLCAVGYGAGHQLSVALDLDTLLGWGSLSLLGIALIVTAALFERHARAIFARLLRFGRALRAWQL